MLSLYYNIDLGVVECTASLHCSGPVLGDMTSFECCVGNASGMAYKKSDSETCHKCIGKSVLLCIYIIKLS